MPKISIIVPVYNVEEYIGTCLKSLVEQTLEDIEIICINDGSTDNSIRIIQYFMQNDFRIKLINTSNNGQGIARNIGIQNAKGEYIAFVDPDDWVDNDMYLKMYNQAQLLNSDIVICNYIRWFEDSKKEQYWPFFEKALSCTKNKRLDIPDGCNIDKSILYSTLLISPCYSWNRIYKRELLIDNNILFSTSKCYEDCIFILKTHILANTVSYIDDTLYKYRRHTNSTLLTLDNRLELLLIEYSSMEKYLSDKGLIHDFELNLRYFLAMNLIYTYRNSNKVQQKEILKTFTRMLNSQDNRLVKNELNYGKLVQYKKFVKKIFSIENIEHHKILTILGIKFKFKYEHLTKHEKIAQNKISKILKQATEEKIKDTYLLFDCLYDTTTESIDAFSLHMFMYDLGLKSYYIIDISSPLYLHLKENNLLNKNIILIKNSYSERPDLFVDELAPYLKNTKFILTSFGLNIKWLEDFFINLSGCNYVFLQHGLIYLKESILSNGYLTPQRFNQILTSSPYECNLLEKHGWKEKQFIKCGLPRYDFLLPNNSSKKKNILIFFTWRKCSNSLFQKSLYYKNIISLLKNEQLQSLIKKHNINIYFAKHHALYANQGINFDIKAPNIKVVDSINLSDYIKNCSCLITDFSSVAFDFMFQEKPVLLYLVDSLDPHLNSWDRQDLDKFEEYKKYLFKNVYTNENELVRKLEEYINNSFILENDLKKEYDSIFFTKKDIRKKIVDKLLKTEKGIS